VKKFHAGNRRPDLVFATGDVAFAGQANEYASATKFFDELLAAANLKRSQLFVIPGNHDVDRKMGTGLKRTCESQQDADEYFGSKVPINHISQKQRGFRRWYNGYFDGYPSIPGEF